MLVDAGVEVVELVRGPIDEPRRARTSSVVRCSSTSAARTRVSGPSSAASASRSMRPSTVRRASRSISSRASATVAAPAAPTPLMSTTAARCWATTGDERGAGRQRSADALVGLGERGRRVAERLGGGVELVVLELRRRPARRRATRRRGRGGTSPPRSRSRPTPPRRRRRRRRPPPRRARRTASGTPLIPVTKSEHGDGPGDDRRRAEELAELRPRQDVERHADGDGEDVGPSPTRAADPQRGAEGGQRQHHQQRIEGDGQRGTGGDGDGPPRGEGADEHDEGDAARRRGRRRSTALAVGAGGASVAATPDEHGDDGDHGSVAAVGRRSSPGARRMVRRRSDGGAAWPPPAARTGDDRATGELERRVAVRPGRRQRVARRPPDRRAIAETPPTATVVTVVSPGG